MKNFIIASGVALVSMCVLSAQEVPPFTFNVGAGFTQPVGNTGRHLDNGWNFDAGAGFNFHPRVGLMVQFNFNQLGINSGTLGNLGVPGGDVRKWSATLDPIVHLNPKGPMDVYLIGGGGLYQRTQELTQPAVGTFVGFDPFFGFYQAAVPAEQVLASYTVNKPGVNGGMGVSFGTKWHAKFYAEARYHRMLLGNDRHTDMVPVTFGFRW
jgi:hypothetical protein